MTSGTVAGLAAIVVGLALLLLGWRLYVLLARRDDAGGMALLQQQLEGLRAQLGQTLAGQGQLLGQQMAQLTGQVNDRLRENVELVQRAQATVGERLDNTTRVIGEVQRGLG